MSLKDMFSAMKREGIVSKPLDLYLLGNSEDGEDRAINVNAPSQAGGCNRANYYMRMGYERDGSIDARTRRIFDNGSYVHQRLQGYLLEMGILIMDEVPLINLEYNIQGHTDGLIQVDKDEIAILEIKSINDSGFNSLKDVREDHKKQGLVYLYCAEERRKKLRDTYKSVEDFNESYGKRYKEYEKRYNHLKSGRKYTREEKIRNEVLLNMLCDNVLFYTKKPITKVVFLYENKNNQDIKEYCLEFNKNTEHILKDVLSRYKLLNACCENQKLPDREGTSKGCNECRWCNYKGHCWTL